MRFLLPAFALLTMLPSILPAQRARFDRIRRAFRGEDAVELGLVGGPNRTTFTGAGPIDAEIRGSIGGYLSVPIIGHLRLRPEALVTGRQIGITSLIQPPCLPPGGCPPVSELQTASFTWLEVPVMLEARFHRALAGWGTPRIYGGPFVAVRLSCSFAVPVDPQPPQLDDTRFVRSCNDATGGATRYNNGDAGFVLGGAIATGGVGLGFRWTRSLVPVAPDQTVTDAGRLIGAKSSTLTLTLELGTRLN